MIVVVGFQVLQEYATDLKAVALTAPWVAYLSTTSVYGDWAGEVVDERSVVQHTPDLYI